MNRAPVGAETLSWWEWLALVVVGAWIGLVSWWGSRGDK